MNMYAEIPVHSLQPFAPDPDEAYPIDTIAHLANVPRHLVLLCCRHNLIAPEVDSAFGGYRFTADAIRILRRVDYLHHDCGINFAGIRMIFGLMEEVERLRARLAET
jgi:DNA-binding transcriptional MerR regulator